MIKIVCFGKIKETYLNELILDYKRRINKYHKLEIIELKDNDNISIETNSVMKYLNDSSYNIALTITGKSYSSLEFAKHIDHLFNSNSNIVFLIGSSNGLSQDVINKCNEEISFSKFTFPHGLFRGILLEQLYRTFKINNNERYHK